MQIARPPPDEGAGRRHGHTRIIGGNGNFCAIRNGGGEGLYGKGIGRCGHLSSPSIARLRLGADLFIQNKWRCADHKANNRIGKNSVITRRQVINQPGEK